MHVTTRLPSQSIKTCEPGLDHRVITTKINGVCFYFLFGRSDVYNSNTKPTTTTKKPYLQNTTDYTPFFNDNQTYELQTRNGSEVHSERQSSNFLILRVRSRTPGQKART